MVGACTAALLACSGQLAVPAQAASDPVQQVNAFFSQYRSAVQGQGGLTPHQVEEEYLTPDLITQLDAYARTHNADPVFRAQNIPASWSVRYGDSGAGHTTVILTENWAGGTSTDVWYQVRIATLVIDGLEDPPAPPDAGVPC
ncbi:hypothetical protein GXW82_42645 [Streptacidiphilus sp. 4-A2]|nr:hypothetical protein [Streptacidiphilus sp. 4-A2]